MPQNAPSAWVCLLLRCDLIGACPASSFRSGAEPRNREKRRPKKEQAERPEFFPPLPQSATQRCSCTPGLVGRGRNWRGRSWKKEKKKKGPGREATCYCDTCGTPDGPVRIPVLQHRATGSTARPQQRVAQAPANQVRQLQARPRAVTTISIHRPIAPSLHCIRPLPPTAQFLCWWPHVTRARSKRGKAGRLTGACQTRTSGFQLSSLLDAFVAI